MFLRIAALLFALVVCAPPIATAQLATFETTGLRLVYIDPTETFLVPHAARTFLNSLAFQKRLFGFEPSDEITLLLVDFSDTGNAGASVVPRNTLTVQIAPLNFAFETIAGNERMNIIMNHELVHVATMDQAAGADRVFRKLFGGKVMPVHEQPESIVYFLWTTPRVAAPRWYHEGIAVFVDTWMAGGLGRAQSGYDEMVFRSMVRDGAPFYDPLGLVSEGTKVDFQLQINSYLYGTRFMTWLARRYSPEKLVQWVSRRDGSRAYYTTQFRQVFGRSLEAVWAEWTHDERDFQLRNLETIHKYPLTPHRDVTTRALGSVSRAFYDASRRRIFAAFNYPGVVAHIGSIGIEDGRIERLRDIKGPVIYTVTSLAYDAAAGALFYTSDNGALRDLMRLDVATRKTEMLLRDVRIGDLAFNAADKSLWGVRHLNGICTLVRIPAPYREWYQVVSWPYGTVMYDVDLSPDGTKLVASFGDISGQQEVRVFTLESLQRKETTPIAKFDFGSAVPNNFVFAPDGISLYGSSYFTGVSNIFRYDLERRKLDAVTNADTGFFRPVPTGDGGLIVFRYSGEGFVPARIEPRALEDVGSITFLGERLIAEHPELKDWMVGSPARVPLDTLPQRTGAYRLAGGLRRESFYPVMQGYKDTAAVGMRINFSDPLQLNRASATLSYSVAADLPSSERVHFTAAYQRFDWRGRFEWNGADFYDFFGPTKTGRKGYLVAGGRKTTLVFDEPRRLDLDVEGRFAGNLDRLPEYQNVAVDIDRLLTLEAKLAYTDIRNSLGNVDDETGYRWLLGAEGQYVQEALFPKIYASYDRGVPLPAGHSSLWFRGAAGFSPRSAVSPFANFFFGGFGNNWVDHRDEKRYREIESFPGVELNEIPGRNFLKGIVELNLPPWRFRHAGTPSFHATWARPAVFVSGLMTNLDAPARRRVATNVGAQLDFRFGLLSALDLTISSGVAVAFQNDGGTKREAMLSVKILR